MSILSFARRSGWLVLGICLCLVSACTTRPGIDWNSRNGVYTYDEAVAEYGPPDKSAQLSDKSIVAEWLTRKGDYRVHGYGYGYGYYGHPYRPYYPGYMMTPYDVTRMPDRHLRLIFDPQGLLKSHHEFSK